MEPRKRLALSQGPALPGFFQTPRSPQHTSHIKRKQVTQMRQMVLVCDDSCNSFFSGRPLPLVPLGFPWASPSAGFFFFVLKWSSCATWAAPKHGHQTLHHIRLNETLMTPLTHKREASRGPDIIYLIPTKLYGCTFIEWNFSSRVKWGCSTQTLNRSIV